MNEKKRLVPPMPVIRKRRPSILVRLIKQRYSLLDVFFERSYSMKMGEVSGLWRKFYSLAQIDIVNRILNADPDLYPKSDTITTFLQQVVGNGVVVSTGEVWKRQRQMMNPSFELTRINEAFPQMIAAAEAMRARLETMTEAPDVAIDFEVTHVTADIIFRTIFSESLPREEAQIVFTAFNHYQELAYNHGVWTKAGLPQKLSIARLRAIPPARTIRDILTRMVRRRLQVLETHPENPPKDILASLIDARDEEGVQFTETELVDQVATMFLAGHETTASALSWAMYLIAKDSDVQQRMRAEVDAVFDSAEGLQSKHFRHLKFTRDVFRETLRLYPPGAAVARNITVPEKIRNKFLKKGSVVFIPVWLIHRHREYWKDPDVFDPDRFSREEDKEAIRHAFLPFSQGPRACMGASFAMQEAVIILSYMVRYFELEALEEHVPRPIARLTVRSENGVKLRLSKRRKATP